MYPIRCFSCNKPLNAKVFELVRAAADENEYKSILQRYKITKLCCKTRYLTSIDAYKMYNTSFQPHSDEDRARRR